MCASARTHTQSKIAVDNLRIKSQIYVIRGSKTQVGIRSTPALAVKRKQPVSNPEMHTNQCEASRNLQDSLKRRGYLTKLETSWISKQGRDCSFSKS